MVVLAAAYAPAGVEPEQAAEPELKIAVQIKPLIGLISAKVTCP